MQECLFLEAAWKQKLRDLVQQQRECLYRRLRHWDPWTLNCDGHLLGELGSFNISLWFAASWVPCLSNSYGLCNRCYYKGLLLLNECIYRVSFFIFIVWDFCHFYNVCIVYICLCTCVIALLINLLLLQWQIQMLYSTIPKFGAKTYYLARFLPKTASKWKKLDQEEGAYP